MNHDSNDPRTQLSAPRFCDVPFPPYRFTPGRDPHPTADPRGHSYQPPGVPHPRVEPVTSEHWRDSIDYLYGCDLYNHGYWWEAHEAWEGLWKVVPRGGAQHSFLQGIIQVAACHLKLYLGHGDGVARLRVSSQAHMSNACRDSADAQCMGINIDTWMIRAESYFDECSTHIPSKYPYLLPD